MADNRYRRLFVYECEGPRLPRSEPACEGFLGIWPESPFFYVFFDRPADACMERWIKTQPQWLLRTAYAMDYDQWQQTSVDECRVGPFCIGRGADRDVRRNAPGDIPIALDPGVVFGSGLHASTRGCLLAIADLFESCPVKTVVDLGTGTGILALACARLGAARVWAVDCNPLAVHVAQENVRANGQQERVALVVARELKVLKKPSDLLLMNLEWPCLCQVLRADDWLGYHWIVLSGFLEAQWNDLRLLLPKAYRVHFQLVLDDWMTVVVSVVSKVERKRPVEGTR